MHRVQIKPHRHERKSSSMNNVHPEQTQQDNVHKVTSRLLLLHSSSPQPGDDVRADSVLLQAGHNAITRIKPINTNISPERDMSPSLTVLRVERSSKCCSVFSDTSSQAGGWGPPGAALRHSLHCWRRTAGQRICPEHERSTDWDRQMVRGLTWNSLPSGDMKVCTPSGRSLILHPAGNWPPVARVGDLASPVLEAGPGLLLG